MNDQQEIRNDDLKVILSKAWSDPGFKAKLLTNAKETLATLGIKLPENVTYKFIEDTPTTRHFVIPAMSADGELKDELAKVAGGKAVAGAFYK